MKDKFYYFLNKSVEEYDELWNNALITFDTNVLLDLYRFSPKTTSDIISTIQGFQDRVFLPHQVAYEFHKNRFSAMTGYKTQLREFEKNATIARGLLNSSLNFPKFSDDLRKEYESLFTKIDIEIGSDIDYFENLRGKDIIYESISSIFTGKILDATAENVLKEIYKEGQIRFEAKLPPGFLDEKDKKGVSKYNDLVIWKEIISKAAKEKKPILLVQNERHEDWWWVNNGNTIGPHFELIKEMKEIAGVAFHMCNSSDFLKFGSHYLKIHVEQNSIHEALHLDDSSENAFHNQVLDKLGFSKTEQDLVTLLNYYERLDGKLSKNVKDWLSSLLKSQREIYSDELNKTFNTFLSINEELKEQEDSYDRNNIEYIVDLTKRQHELSDRISRSKSLNDRSNKMAEELGK